MNWFQTTITLKPRARGFHLVTAELIESLQDQLSPFQVGIAHFFIQHTSAGLTINENADPDVRHDMEAHFNQMVPENAPYYRHTLEGSDDMPAHIKHSLLGTALSIPIRAGALALGTWQGIYLCEHRDHGGARHVVVTLFGE